MSIEQMAREQFGEPNMRMSHGAASCGLAHGLKVSDLKTGAWFDFEEGTERVL